MKQIDRVLEFFQYDAKTGIVNTAVWIIEKWAVEQGNITAGSALRHCRTLVTRGDLEHPYNHKGYGCLIDKHYFRLTEQGRKREISATGKSDSEETPGRKEEERLGRFGSPGVQKELF